MCMCVCLYASCDHRVTGGFSVCTLHSSKDCMIIMYICVCVCMHPVTMITGFSVCTLHSSIDSVIIMYVYMCVRMYASCNHDYWLQCLYHTLKQRPCDNYVCIYAPHSHSYWLPVLFCLFALYLRDVAIAAVFLYYCQCLKLMCLHV